MAPARKRARPKIDEPFDSLKTANEERTKFTEFLADELEAGLRARSALMDEYGLIDLWNALYEQAPRNRQGPWPGAADLGSYIGTEKVDATRARFVKIIGKAEPLCVVEGRGANARNAPYVEEAHEWHQQREEKLFVSLVKWAHAALIERVGVLETYEKIERVVTVEERDLLLEVDPNNVDPATGQPAIVLENGEPKPVKGEDGKFVDAQDGEPQAKVKVRSVEHIHHGPRHRVISGKDFVWLPVHARDREEQVYAYFKRIHLRNDQLAERVKDGVYDKDAVEKLGKLGRREQRADEARQQVAVEHTGHEDTQEHELWEGQVYKDLDGWGPRWHLVTLSLDDRVLLRVKDDTINKSRFSLLVLFPRAQGVDGYSFLGDKLYTLIEEHASERNMIADRSVMAFNAPILRVMGSTWKPQIQPWGPRQVIDVNDKDELTQANVKDVPESGVLRERQTLQAAERVSGASDIVSSGVVEGANPTATQVASSAAYSNARLEEQVALFQEEVERLYELRHLMLRRKIAFNGSLEVDESVVTRLQDRGLELRDGKLTAHLFDGAYRFKPRGSVESADPVLLERKFQQRYASLAMLAKFNPGVAQRLMGPELTDALIQDWADTYKPRDRAPFMRPSMPPTLPMMPFGGQPTAMPMLPPGMGDGNPMAGLLAAAGGGADAMGAM